MKRNLRKYTIGILMCLIVVGMLPVAKVSAKKKISLSQKALTIQVGKTKTLKLKNADKKVTWSVASGKGNILLKSKKKTSVVLQGKKVGTAKVQAKLGKKKYTCQITVKKAAKNAADVANLKKLIAKLGKNTTLSKNLNNFNNKNMYEWDDSGRLVTIHWIRCNLKGAVSFASLPTLEEITLSLNQLTGIDVTKNKNLECLYFEGNRIAKIDVTKCPKLIGLGCGTNQLSNLDVSKNSKLSNLTCQGNRLTSLDLSKNPKLKTLFCEKNHLTYLDLSKNSLLDFLYVGNAELKSINLSKCRNLTSLRIDNYDDDGKQASTGIERLDLSQNIKLEEVEIHTTNLTEIDLTANKMLQWIEIRNNPLLKTVDVRGLTKITTWFRVWECPSLEKIYVKGSAISNIKKEDLYSIDNNPSFEIVR